VLLQHLLLPRELLEQLQPSALLLNKPRALLLTQLAERQLVELLTQLLQCELVARLYLRLLLLLTCWCCWCC
jgi:hypothetical protein